MTENVMRRAGRPQKYYDEEDKINARRESMMKHQKKVHRDREELEMYRANEKTNMKLLECMKTVLESDDELKGIICQKMKGILNSKETISESLSS